MVEGPQRERTTDLKEDREKSLKNNKHVLKYPSFRITPPPPWPPLFHPLIWKKCRLPLGGQWIVELLVLL